MSENPLGGLPATRSTNSTTGAFRRSRSRSTKARPTSARRVVLSIKDLKVEFPTDDGVVQGGRRRDLRRARGRDARHRGGVGLGQERHVDVDPRPAAEVGEHHAAAINFRGTELLDLNEKQLREVRGARDRDDLPGRARRAEPGVHGRATRSRRRSRSTTRRRQARAARPRASSCSTSSASRRRASASTSTRTSTPAACGSGR